MRERGAASGEQGTESARATARRRGLTRWVALCLLAAPGSLLPAAPAAQAQSVVEVLREQRLAARAAEVSAALGPRVTPRPVAPIGAPDPHVQAALAIRAALQAEADSVAAARRDSAARAVDLGEIVWRKVEPDGQGDFLAAYGEVFWRAAGPRSDQPLDTTQTPLLRGRLQAVFGRPTRNADAFRQVGYAGSEYLQFEYWFVANDSIPVLVFDLDGPFGRGLLIAGSEQHASLLPLLKDDLAARLAEANGPVPWVDYYHAFDRGSWFRTGYNGTELFTVSIRPPRWAERRDIQRWNVHR